MGACINGTNFLVYLNGQPIAGSTSCRINTAQDLPSCASKDSGGWDELMPGLRSWSVEVDALVQFDNYWATDDIFSLIPNRSKVTVKFATTKNGDSYWEGDAYLQTNDINADMEQPTTGTLTFNGTGELEQKTV
jgi:predicted secreted protein